MTEPRLKVVPVRMKESALELVDAIAAQEGRSRGDTIRRLLGEAIEARRAVKRQQASTRA